MSDPQLKTYVALGASLLLLSVPGAATAEGNPAAPGYGLGAPGSTGDLPPGLLRSSLEDLPPASQSRALQWLQDLDFPAADVAELRVDAQGGVFYEDPAASSTSESTPVVSAALTQGETFTLHSRPGASRVVYLDMDGHVVSGTAWNSGNADPLYMTAFDTNGDTSTFSQSELDIIADTWRRIAEDFANYDIDVTTEEPPSFGPNVGHILVSPRHDEFGNPIYGSGAGGVAYVNVWGLSNFTYYQPALVFPENLGNDVHNIAEAASHELGHNLGLSHDGTSTVGYYEGHGTGNIDWGPIMGVGYYGQVTQWSKGEYADANNTQDDLAIMDGKLTYTVDDHADADFLSASALVRADATTITATNPVSDPGNASTSNKGIIEDRTDVDLFYVDVSAGTIDLTVTPVWIEDFRAHSRRGANLDVQATLYDDLGGVVAQDNPTTDTFAQVTATVAGGRYYLAVEGVGVYTPSTGYSDYGSLGQYFINGSVPADITYTAPPTAPTDLAAALNIDGNGVELTWTDPASTPDTNEAGYRVFRSVDAGPWGLRATLGADSSFFADNNLGNGDYSYYLELFNGAGTSTTGATADVTVSLPVFAVATSESTSAGQVSSGSYLNTQVAAGSETLAELHQGGRPSRRVSAVDHTWTVTGIQPGAIVTLDVDAEAPANGEGDDFDFTWSLNGGPVQSLGLLANGTGRQVLSASLPASASGSLTLNVVDTDRSQGNSASDTVTVYSIVVASTGDPAEQPPVVVIDTPADGFFTPEGTEFALSGTADDFEDGDLSSSLQWSSSLDGALGGGSSVLVNGPAALLTQGVHDITATVTDSAGNTSDDTISVTITDPNAATNLFADSLSGSTSPSGKKWNATATAVVVDDFGDPVENATVSGAWSGAVSGSGSCVTDAAGTCSVTRNNLRHNQSSVTFTITNLSHVALSYDGSTNMSVTMTKP